MKTVVRDLRSHPKLKLPVEPTKDEIYQCYQIMSASAVMYDEMLLCILHVPLVDRSKASQVFKIHNLLLPLPPLNKQMRHKLDHQYLAISTDKLYVTFPTAEEIFSCRMSIGSFCEINNAIYPTSTINLCEYALFMEQPTLVRKLCKVDANSLKLVFSSSYAGCFLPCLLVLLFLRVGSLRLFWGMVVRGCARRDLC